MLEEALLLLSEVVLNFTATHYGFQWGPHCRGQDLTGVMGDWCIQSHLFPEKMLTHVTVSHVMRKYRFSGHLMSVHSVNVQK